jgi:hypothetical protein
MGIETGTGEKSLIGTDLWSRNKICMRAKSKKPLKGGVKAGS